MQIQNFATFSDRRKPSSLPSYNDSFNDHTMKTTCSHPIGPLCTKFFCAHIFPLFLSKQFVIIYKLIINILNQIKSCSSPSLPLCSLFHRIPQFIYILIYIYIYTHIYIYIYIYIYIQVDPLSSSPIQSFQLRFRSETRTHTAMAEKKEKETIMVLKVDLQCHKCYKKVKKVLCKFPQIRDQIYDEKQNQVVIKVVCCSPEKIRDRICCKGGGAIKSIEIKEPEKPKPKPAPTPAPEKPKDSPPKPAPAPAPEKPKDPPPKPAPAPEKPKDPPPKPAPSPAPAPEKPKNPPPNPGPAPIPVGHPTPYPVNVNACCMDCYHGHPGGPCQTGYGGVAPYIQYDGYYGRPVYDSYGGGRGYNTNYCVARSDCFSEENPQGCTVM